MSREASVSVIVPCHNYGRFLKDCVESVLAQTGVDLRVLILDDASTDNSAQVAAQLAAADSRVECRTHATNQGHIGTYNEGVRWASGTYTVVLDADDMLTKGSLRRACDLLDAHPEVGFGYGPVRFFYDDSRPGRAKTAQAKWRIWPGRKWFEIRCRITENCIAQASVVMRTGVLKQVGGFRPELPHAADMEMWLRLALYADVGYVAGSHQAYYRDHPAAMHRRVFGTILADLVQVREALEMLFREHAEVIGDRDRLAEHVRRTLARRALRFACRAYDWGPLDIGEATALEEFAGATWGNARTLPEARALRWRKRAGPRASRIVQPFLLLSIAQRLNRLLGRLRLQRAGLL